MTPEERARKEIDRRLGQAGWAVQDYPELNIRAAAGVAEGFDQGANLPLITKRALRSSGGR